MRKHSNKDFDKYLRQLVREGWVMINKGKPGHFRIQSPKGTRLTVPSSPSCPHALENMKKDIGKILKKEHENEQ